MSDPFGIKSSKKAAKAQEEATALQRQQANLQAGQRRRDTVRQARIAVADARQAAASQGVSTSSAAQGGVGSVVSQFGSNISFLDKSNLIADQTSEAVGRQRMWQAKAAKSKAIWGLGVKVAFGANFG